MLLESEKELWSYMVSSVCVKATRTLTVVSVLCLSGCNALSNNADSGPITSITGSQSLQSREYQQRLSGNVSKESTVWRLGSLEGFCSVQSDDNSNENLLIDDVLLATDALFETAIPEISESGNKVLEQLVRRLNSYSDIKRIELVGHADERGSASKNFKLAGARAESVRLWLVEKMSKPVDIRVLSRGESESQKREYVEDLATDRRVDVRIIAAGSSGSSIDSTLCSVPTGGDQLATSAALQVNTQKALTDKAKRNRLEAFDGELPLSPGDQIQLMIAGDEDWNGIYEVSVGGGIDIPLLGRQSVSGLTIPAVKTILADELVDQQLIRRNAVNVDASVVEWSPVEVFVRGAVFQKGRVSINFAKPEFLELRGLRDGGDDGQGRLLSFALQHAGGVRPDADLANIQILRHGETIPVDLSGLAHGELVRDVPLISGDEVVVPSTGRFEEALAAPTQITPPGIRIFMSNASAPIFGNAAANITKDETSLPYGSRVVHALTTMNCIGGTQSVNAARRTILVSKDHLSGELSVTERSVQRLLREPNRLDVNPYLMPGDAVACFDSDVSNIREIAKVFNDVLSPLVALSVIFGQI